MGRRLGCVVNVMLWGELGKIGTGFELGLPQICVV